MGLPYFNSRNDLKTNLPKDTCKEIRAKKKKYVPKSLRSRGRKRKKKKNNNDSFSDRIRKRVNFSLKKIGMPKNFLIFYFLGYSEDILVNHLKKYLGEKCEVCKRVELTLSNGQVDHKTPVHLCRTVEDVKRLNLINNLRFICAECNSAKGGYYKKKDEDYE